MKKMISVMLVILLFIFQGCGVKEENKEVSKTKEATDVANAVTPTVKPEATPTVAPTPTVIATPTIEPTPTAVPEGLVLPVTKNEAGKLLIQTISTATDNPFTSYLITSSTGESVVVDPYKMPRKKVVNLHAAAIVNTHSHYDHNDNVFNKDYKDAQLLSLKLGEIQTKDFHIFNIAASHDEKPIAENYCSDNFIVFEVDGLRIAHLGDCGQTELTADQLTALGEIDICFTQFENSYSAMDLENAKGFALLEQLNPKIFIPTHYSDRALPIIEEKYGKITEYENLFEISKEDLPGGTLHPYRILNNYKYK